MILDFAAGLLALATVAAAEPAPEAPVTASAAPVPVIRLERLPPDTSWDFGVSFSYGAVDHWAEYFDAWVGFGARGAWGKHRGDTRFGLDAQFTVEGPLGVHTSLGLEPHLSVDTVGNRGLLLGAGVGAGLFYHSAVGPSFRVRGERTFDVQPSVVARIGWSQGWTRVGRRVFLYLEPKVRPTFRDAADGVRRFAPNPVLSVVVGSGRGR